MTVPGLIFVTGILPMTKAMTSAKTKLRPFLQRVNRQPKNFASRGAVRIADHDQGRHERGNRTDTCALA